MTHLFMSNQKSHLPAKLGTTVRWVAPCQVHPHIVCDFVTDGAVELEVAKWSSSIKRHRRRPVSWVHVSLQLRGSLACKRWRTRPLGNGRRPRLWPLPSSCYARACYWLPGRRCSASLVSSAGLPRLLTMTPPQPRQFYYRRATRAAKRTAVVILNATRCLWGFARRATASCQRAARSRQRPSMRDQSLCCHATYSCQLPTAQLPTAQQAGQRPWPACRRRQACLPRQQLRGARASQQGPRPHASTSKRIAARSRSPVRRLRPPLTTALTTAPRTTALTTAPLTTALALAPTEILSELPCFVKILSELPRSHLRVPIASPCSRRPEHSACRWSRRFCRAAFCRRRHPRRRPRPQLPTAPRLIAV